MNITLSTTNQANTSLPKIFIDNDAQSPALDPRLVVTDYLWKYCSPFLILLGTFGNIMSIIVLSRKSMRKMTSLPYLLALSLTDIVALYTGLLRLWMRNVFKLDIRHLSQVVCKIHLFLVHTSAEFSVWILVALSIERLICVCFPFKAKTLCNRKRAVLTIVLILLALCLLNGHILVGYGSLYDPDTFQLISPCVYLSDKYKIFSVKVWPWVEMSVYFLIPACIMIVCNISLITKFISSRRFRKASIDAAKEQSVKSSSSMTALLVSLNTSFIVTTAPVTIYLILFPNTIVAAVYEDGAQLALWFAIVVQLMYVNHSVNFLFYCISGPRFRKELKVMCGRGTGGVPQ